MVQVVVVAKMKRKLLKVMRVFLNIKVHEWTQPKSGISIR